MVLVLVAAMVGCQSSKWVKLREKPHNPLTERFKISTDDKIKPSSRTQQVLRLYDLTDALDGKPEKLITQLQIIAQQEPNLETIHALSEICYLAARKCEKSNPKVAVSLYGSSVLYAYEYLFESRAFGKPNHYDPQFRAICDLYNGSLESALRLTAKDKKLQPGKQYTIETAVGTCQISAILRGGRWKNEDFDHFEFVSDYQIEGLRNHYRTHGLGVPLIGVRKRYQGEPKEAKFYPVDLSFPVTAFLRPCMNSKIDPKTGEVHAEAILEIYDPLTLTDIAINSERVPLESDLSTPLAHFLSKPELEVLATAGLVDPQTLLKKIGPEGDNTIMGLYMFEPYQPGKIPVLMVHGLWSSPITWMEMYNDLRNSPEIRDRYQFWFYLYPTGHPFWVSAARLRHDLAELRQILDPNHQEPALDQMVLIGHSMGGLVSRLQTLNSRDDFWHLVSDQPFERFEAEPETRDAVRSVIFFQPNPSIRRVITIATPHRGSEFSNDVTQWLANKLISIPRQVFTGQDKFIAKNKPILKDTKFFKIKTSIDSLSPTSPVFDAMLHAQRAPWIHYHNVVASVPQDEFWSKFAAGTDGVVAEKSAHMDDVDSELVVKADHTTVHAHPKTVLEVRRILLEHLRDLRNHAPTQFMVSQPKAKATR
jgi:pimeloyl-ACP methyl ester carboxylesterase